MQYLSFVLSIILVSMGFIFLGNNIPSDEEFNSGTIHVGVVVKDLKKSTDFYTKIIGMEKTSSFEVNPELAQKTGLTNGTAFNVTVLKLNNGKQDTQWKLMSFDNKAKHPKQKFISDDTGMQYITILVKSLKPIIDRLKANNIKLLGETPTPLPDGKHFALIQDPDGTFIELIGDL